MSIRLNCQRWVLVIWDGLPDGGNRLLQGYNVDRGDLGTLTVIP
jgi:hypothetical protein